MTKRNDGTAFNNIVKKYQQPVYNLCRYMLKDTLEAEDAAQEVFVRAYTKLHSYDEQRKFSSWLLSIASHYCIDQLKRPGRDSVSLNESFAGYHPTGNPAVQPETMLIKNETAAEVRHYLDLLPPHYQAPIILKYWQAMSYQEMAQVLNTTVNAIRSNLFRARRKMAQMAGQQAESLAIPSQIALGASF